MWFIFRCAAVMFFSCQVHSDLPKKSRLIADLLDDLSYDSTERPVNSTHPDDALVVDVDLVILSVGPVKSEDMLLDMSFYLRMEWQDRRLSYNPRTLRPTRNLSSEHISEQELRYSLEMNHKLLQRLWIPDLYFPGSKDSHVHNVLTPNVLISLWPNGTILYSQRISTSSRCYMNLMMYPHDQQQCALTLASFSLPLGDLKLRWSSKRSPTKVITQEYLEEFLLINVTQDEGFKQYDIGKFAQLEATISLHRQIVYYATQVYLPTTLIVMISWIAFWIDLDATAGRVSISLLTMITITTQSASGRVTLPRVPYIKAIDIFMAVNIFYVFATCMEYAIALVLSRRYNKIISAKPGVHHDSSKVKDQQCQQGQRGQQGQQCQQGQQGQQGRQSQQGQQGRNKSNNLVRKTRHNPACSCCMRRTQAKNTGRIVDWHARYMFPCTYFACLFVYCLVLPWSS